MSLIMRCFESQSFPGKIRFKFDMIFWHDMIFFFWHDMIFFFRFKQDRTWRMLWFIWSFGRRKLRHLLFGFWLIFLIFAFLHFFLTWWHVVFFAGYNETGDEGCQKIIESLQKNTRLSNLNMCLLLLLFFRFFFFLAKEFHFFFVCFFSCE